MKGIDPDDVRFDFYLTKNDVKYLEELQEKAADIKAVAIHDPVPYRELIETLSQSDVGVHLLAPTNFNNEHALPNKFFDFVQARLGVVIGPSPEMAKEVKRHGFGQILPDFTAESLNRCIRELTVDQVDEWKAAAHAAAYELSAETQAAVWKKAIDALAERARD